MLYAKFGWNKPSGSEKKIFQNFVIVFSLFHYPPPPEKVRLFLWTNLNSLHTRMLCAKFGWNWPTDSGEDFLKLRQCLFALSSVSPLGERPGPSFEQTWILNTQECFMPCWVGISPVVLEKKIFEICLCIFAIALLSPIGKLWGPSFEQTSIYFTQGCFLPKWFWRRRF